MDYEDYVCGDDHLYDPEADVFVYMSNMEPWNFVNADEDEWDSYSDWVYDGEFTFAADGYFDY